MVDAKDSKALAPDLKKKQAELTCSFDLNGLTYEQIEFAFQHLFHPKNPLKVQPEAAKFLAEAYKALAEVIHRDREKGIEHFVGWIVEFRSRVSQEIESQQAAQRSELIQSWSILAGSIYPLFLLMSPFILPFLYKSRFRRQSLLEEMCEKDIPEEVREITSLVIIQREKLLEEIHQQRLLLEEALESVALDHIEKNKEDFLNLRCKIREIRTEIDRFWGFWSERKQERSYGRVLQGLAEIEALPQRFSDPEILNGIKNCLKPPPLPEQEPSSKWRDYYKLSRDEANKYEMKRHILDLDSALKALETYLEEKIDSIITILLNQPKGVYR